MGKVVNQVKLSHSKSIWASFWGKRWKNLQNDQNWPFWTNLSHFFGKIHHCGSLWATSVWNDLKKLKNSKSFADVPPLPQEWNFLRFLQKWDTLVVKDGKSCELGEIGHSKSIWASFWGEKMEKPAKWPKLAILSQSKPLFCKIRHINWDSAEIFKFSSVLIIA